MKIIGYILVVLTTSAICLYTLYGLVMTDEHGLWPCEEITDDNCYWDAKHRGDGTGKSFWVVDGVYHYVD